MALGTAPVRPLTGVELMAHLFRRAGFGADREQIERAMASGYEATVEELLNPPPPSDLENALIFRYYIDMKEQRQADSGLAYWVYRMVSTPRPLEEKMALFWHGLFATGNAKVDKIKQMGSQIDMFRKHGLGSFRDLLIELSKDPAMIIWLDNNYNTKDVHNENYGRELLELFSMGIGNYTEQDIKECARAFTGWTISEAIPSAFPHGQFEWEFQFHPELHDDGEKVFLGERGNFDGTDIIDIIVRQPATARYIARKLYDFFVSDRPNDDAIAELADVFVASRYNIRSVLRALFLSDTFRSELAYFAKVKSPAEHVAGMLRLAGDFQYPTWGIREVALECRYLGQDLLHPPSVEGWHTGREWLDTGTLVARINWAADQIGDIDKPGVRKIVERLRGQGTLSPEELVDACLDLIGPLQVRWQTRAALINFAEQSGPLDLADGDYDAERRVGDMLRMIVATREFQLA
jgi:uncharacterized protein (DUF1800 family)